MHLTSTGLAYYQPRPGGFDELSDKSGIIKILYDKIENLTLSGNPSLSFSDQFCAINFFSIYISKLFD